MGVLLVGTDFSTRSDRALRRAALLAHQGGGQLMIVHVIDDDQPPEMLRAQSGAGSVLLDRIARTIREIDGIPCATELRFGRISQQMNEMAAAISATAMVLGPHRRMGLRGLFGGSTIERVIRGSRIPVVVTEAVPSAPYSRVLLATDCGAGSIRAARFVRQFTGIRPEETDLLHLYDAEARRMLGRAPASGDAVEGYLAERTRNARKQLETFAASAGFADARLLVREMGGDPGAEIQRIAVEEGRDLIVLSPGNKSLIERTLLGSVTRRVLETSEIDVLIVPEAE